MQKAQKELLTHLRAAHAVASTLEPSRERSIVLTDIETAALRAQTIPGEFGRKISPLGD